MSDRQGEPKFALVRGRREPMVWPFRSAEEAEEWALDHDCIDWRVEALADRDEHEAICGRCRESWPCEHVRLDRTAARILHESKNLCVRCRKRVGWMEVRILGGGDFGEDVKYHGRQGACRKEGLRRLRALDTPESRRELERLDKEAEYARASKEWRDRDRAQRRVALLASLNPSKGGLPTSAESESAERSPNP